MQIADWQDHSDITTVALWGNAHDKSVNIAQNKYPSTISQEQEWYPLQRLSAVPNCL